MNLLIVDDEPLMIKRLRLINWQLEGFNAVYAAKSGQHALQLIQSQHINVLISDIKMPDMTGLQLYEHARVIKPNLTCIFLSGYAEFEYARSAIQLNAISYLTKPVNETQLLEAVHLAAEKSLEAEKHLDNQRLLDKTIFQNYCQHLIPVETMMSFIQSRYLSPNIVAHIISVELTKTKIPESLINDSLIKIMERVSSEILDAAFIFESDHRTYFAVLTASNTAYSLFTSWLKTFRFTVYQTLESECRIIIDAQSTSLQHLPDALITFRKKSFYAPQKPDGVTILADDTSESTYLELFHSTPTFDELFRDGNLSTRTLYQPDFKQKRQIIPDTGSRPAGIICRSLYAH